jgi:hypothetical protein
MLHALICKAVSTLLAGFLLASLGAAVSPATAADRPARKQFSDREIIVDLTRLHVYKQTGIPQKKLQVRVEALSGGYARARVTTTDGSTDPAKVYLKKGGGAWKVIAGPGTSFTGSELQRLGVPRSVR